MSTRLEKLRDEFYALAIQQHIARDALEFAQSEYHTATEAADAAWKRWNDEPLEEIVL